MARVLGVSCYFHDAAAVRVEDGALVLAAEEERFTRKKHDASFPRRAIEFCLEPRRAVRRLRRLLREPEGQVQPRADDRRGDGEARTRRVRALDAGLARPSATGSPGGSRSLTGVPRDRVALRRPPPLARGERLLPVRVRFRCRRSPWTAWASGRRRRSGGRRPAPAATGSSSRGEVDFPHSLGLFYSAFTDFLGFEVNEGEYKVMGMAPYGEPRFVDELSRVLSDLRRTAASGSIMRLLLVPLLARARPGPTKVTRLLGTRGRVTARRADSQAPARTRSQRLRRHRRQRPGGDRARDRQPRAAPRTSAPARRTSASRAAWR